MCPIAPRHPAFEHFRIVTKVLSRHFRKDVAQILFGIEAVGLARLDEAVDGGARCCPSRAVAEEPVFPADGEGADGVLRRVVRHGDAAVFEIAAETVFRFQGVVQRGSELAFRQHLSPQVFRPREESLHQGPFLLDALLFPFFRIEVLEFSFDGEDLPHLPDGRAGAAVTVFRDRQGFFFRPLEFHGFEEFPPQVRPASGVLYREFVVAFVLVVDEDAAEAAEEFLGAVAAAARLVVEDADGGARLVGRARGVEPHVRKLVLAVRTPAAFPMHLHGGLVGVEHGRFKQARMHMPHEFCDIVFVERDRPVRHGGAGKREAELRPLLFLPMKGNCEEEFLRENPGGEGRRCDGVREEGRGRVRLGDTEAAFLPARRALVDGAGEAPADEPRRIEDDFFSKDFFADLHERHARMDLAGAFRFRDVDGNVFDGEVLQRDGAGRLLAARVRLDGRFRDLRLGLLRPRFLLGFVERSEKGKLGTVLVFEDGLGFLRLRRVEGVQELVDAFFHVR